MGGGLDGYSWTAGIGRVRLIVELSKSGITGCTSAVSSVQREREEIKKFDKVQNIIMAGRRRKKFSSATSAREPFFRIEFPSSGRLLAFFNETQRAVPQNSSPNCGESSFFEGNEGFVFYQFLNLCEPSTSIGSFERVHS